MEKISRFSGRIWLDWGNNARAGMVGFGFIGLIFKSTTAQPFISEKDILKISKSPFFVTIVTYLQCMFWEFKG